MGDSKPKTYLGYAGRFPRDVQQTLMQIRETIQRAAPKAQETISYGMPAFKVGGILVCFAAHTHHIGFYPGASVIAAFKKELARYKHAKGSVQFPFRRAFAVRAHYADGAIPRQSKEARLNREGTAHVDADTHAMAFPGTSYVSGEGCFGS